MKELCQKYYTTKFDENSDSGRSYLCRIDMTKSDKIKVEVIGQILEQGYTKGTLLSGAEWQIHLDTGAGNSGMSKTHYLRYKSLHLLQNFAPKPQTIQVGKGECVSVLFIIPVILHTYSNEF